MPLPVVVAAALKFIGQAVASAAAAKGVDAAIPKKSIVPTQDIPQSQAMDLNALVGQRQGQQSQLPKIQLQNRLPRPY